jgi:hypothetical protein
VEATLAPSRPIRTAAWKISIFQYSRAPVLRKRSPGGCRRASIAARWHSRDERKPRRWVRTRRIRFPARVPVGRVSSSARRSASLRTSPKWASTAVAHQEVIAACRHYYHDAACGHGCPRDTDLGLAAVDLTPTANEVVCRAGVQASFAEAATKILPRLVGRRRGAQLPFKNSRRASRIPGGQGAISSCCASGSKPAILSRPSV